jgi:hypothetical protein
LTETLPEPRHAVCFGIEWAVEDMTKSEVSLAAGGIDEPRCLAFKRFPPEALPVSPPSLPWQFLAPIKRHPIQHQGKVSSPVELFPCKKGGGVDIAILRVKIGLNFGTCKAEFVREG